jgi:hypothetical protein
LRDKGKFKDHREILGKMKEIAVFA